MARLFMAISTLAVASVLIPHQLAHWGLRLYFV